MHFVASGKCNLIWLDSPQFDSLMFESHMYPVVKYNELPSKAQSPIYYIYLSN